MGCRMVASPSIVAEVVDLLAEALRIAPPLSFEAVLPRPHL